MKSSVLFVATALLGTVGVRADLVTETYGPTTVNTAIPDNNPTLTSFLLSINTSAIQSLTEVVVSFELRGPNPGDGWASDMFASLLKSPLNVAPTGSDPSAILLNRVGITTADPLGFGYDGWNITLRDQAPVGDPALTDIHNENPIGTILTGTYEPDGRLAETDTLRPALLSVFLGGSGNGDWRLNIGDLADSGNMQLVSWSLTLTGSDGLPETGNVAAGFGLAGLVATIAWRRQRRA